MGEKGLEADTGASGGRGNRRSGVPLGWWFGRGAGKSEASAGAAGFGGRSGSDWGKRSPFSPTTFRTIAQH